MCVALGLLLARDGHGHDHQIIPAAWIMDETTVHADQPRLRPGTATPILGYGYQTWILPTKRRMFLLWGVRGQRIFVDPEKGLVIVNTAVHTLPFDLPPLEEMAELWFAVVRHCS